MLAAHATRETDAVSDPPERLRIVSLVTNLYIAGDANRLLAYARAVDATRFDHRLLLLVRPDDASLDLHGPMVDKFEAHGIRIDHLDEPSRVVRSRGRGRLRTLYDDGRAFSRILRRLRDYFVEHRVDVVDARLSYSILLGALAGRWAGVLAIVATEYGQEFWRPPIRWLAGQLAYKMCDALISDSQYRIDSYQKWLWFGHKRAVTIENGIFTPRSERCPAEMRREFGLPADPGTRVIGQVSRLVPYKGHSVLIDAARRVLDVDPDVAFLICGYSHVPNYIDELNSQAAALDIADLSRFVLVSSGGVYGRPAELPIREDQAADPIDPYSRSKLDAELVADDAARDRGWELAVGRVFNVVGPGQDENHICGAIAAQLATPHSDDAPSSLRLGSLHATRDLIDVRDLARSLALLARAPLAHRTYNLASGRETSMRTVVDTMLSVGDPIGRLEVEEGPRRELDIPRHYADVTRVTAIGGSATTPLRESLADVIAYYEHVAS